jgi:ABC-2 type transport system ATP-binding protein
MIRFFVPHNAIRALVEGGTDVLLTTQYLDEADHLASRIVIIDRGRAVAAGTPAELKARVGRKFVEVLVRDRQDLVEVARALKRFGEGEPLMLETTRRVSIGVAGGTGRLWDGLRALDSDGIGIDDVAVRLPKLDEVFLALTGLQLQEETTNGGKS